MSAQRIPTPARPKMHNSNIGARYVTTPARVHVANSLAAVHGGPSRSVGVPPTAKTSPAPGSTVVTRIPTDPNRRVLGAPNGTPKAKATAKAVTQALAPSLPTLALTVEQAMYLMHLVDGAFTTAAESGDKVNAKLAADTKASLTELAAIVAKQAAPASTAPSA